RSVHGVQMKIRVRRRGFTLNEIMISLVIMGVIGATFMRMLRTQTRFLDAQTNKRAARSVARSGMNLLLSELRMVQDTLGVDSASSDGKGLRVIRPYRYGLYCG